VERSEIDQTLHEIDGLRRNTRRALQSSWFPLVLFGALALVASPLCLIGDGRAAGVFWALAGPAGGVATGVHYARREATIGVSRPAAPYTQTATSRPLP